MQSLNDVLEGQAKRIAYTLHSEAGQLLASAHLALANLAADQPASMVEQIRGIRGMLSNVEERLRDISHELRPPILDDLGLVPALEFLAKSASMRWGLSVNVDATPLHHQLASTVETTLYRVAQEGLSNAIRHADATRVDIKLRETRHRVKCSVRDNGVGLGVKRGKGRRGGLGLREIRERIDALGGVVCLSPRPGRGTNLSVEIPLEM
jgi:two-component system, NarL family, sensor histidine kinase DegS